MNVKNVERAEKSLVIMDVEIDAEEFEEAVQKAYKKKAASINLPGFRKGKVPRKMIEKVYGQSFLYEEAANDIYPEAYKQALEQYGFEPVERGNVDVQNISSEGFSFRIKVHVRPEVELSQYKGLSTVVKKPQVDESEIDLEIERLLERNARIVSVERPAQNGDTVVLDFTGYIDGVAFDNGFAENESLVLGSNRFIPGFEQQLVGKSAGEECEVNITFPEKYAEDLCGKNAVFKCLIKEVKEIVKPELDDEFVKDISPLDTLEEFKSSLRTDMLSLKERGAEQDYKNKIIDILLENLKADIPDCMIEEQFENIMFGIKKRLSKMGMELEDYLEYHALDMNDYLAQQRITALKRVKEGLAFQKIAELEGLTVSEEELENEYEEYAKRHKTAIKEVKRKIDRGILTTDLLYEKAANLVLDSSVKKEDE